MEGRRRRGWSEGGKVGGRGREGGREGGNNDQGSWLHLNRKKILLPLFHIQRVLLLEEHLLLRALVSIS